MKDFHLRFCVEKRGWFTRMFDLLEVDIESVPTAGGAYVLGTSDGTMLTYPWGSSPVFYIGKATNLRRRLLTHRNHICGARQDHDDHWWPRYQYGAAFGADCAYYSRSGPENVQNIESLLIETFYDVLGSIPVANSAWPSRIAPSQD